MRRLKMSNLRFYVGFIIIFVPYNIRCDLYTSLGQMTKLVETQHQLTNLLRSFIEHQTRKIEEAKELLKDFDLLAESSKQNEPEHFIGNPVNALLLIKKLTKDLQNIVDTLNTYSKLKGKPVNYEILILKEI
jgi:hypothetical protein